MLDYAPFASTVTNFIEIFQKCVVIPIVKRNDSSLQDHQFLKYVDNKSIFKCFLLLIPFIGNIIVGIHQLLQKKNQDEISKALQNNDMTKLSEADQSTKKNGDFMLELMGITGDRIDHLKHADKSLLSNEGFMLDALQNNITALQYADDSLRSNPNFMRDAMRINVTAFEYAGDNLKKDESLVIEMLKKNRGPNYIHLVDKDLKSQESFWKKAMEIPPATALSPHIFYEYLTTLTKSDPSLKTNKAFRQEVYNQAVKLQCSQLVTTLFRQWGQVW